MREVLAIMNLTENHTKQIFRSSSLVQKFGSAPSANIFSTLSQLTHTVQAWHSTHRAFLHSSNSSGAEMNTGQAATCAGSVSHTPG